MNNSQFINVETGGRDNAEILKNEIPALLAEAALLQKNEIDAEEKLLIRKNANMDFLSRSLSSRVRPSPRRRW